MPMWYLYKDGDILFAAEGESQKVKHIARTGRATVVVDRREIPYYAVMLPGSATIEEAMSAEDQCALYSRYLDEEEAQRYMARTSGGSTVAIRVKIERFVEFHGNAGT